MNILTMNQNVFGSSFVNTRRSNFTESVINSELIIPDSAVELSYEEMEYVDGGWFLGVTISAAASISLYSTVLGMMDKQVHGYGYGSLTANMREWVAMSFSAAVTSASNFVAAIIGKLTTFLKAHPAVYIAAGIIGLAASYVLGGMLVAGARSRGFKTGFEIGVFKVSFISELV
ncbi:MAG TPA: hypothetical protein GX012_04610 [Acholeplasma sp.]|nr:hypothetical protein [Acholeplasma sp.]